MPSLVIVTGCPGMGKTTLAERLCASRPRGLHLAADAFYAFICRPIPPVRPESRDQNATVNVALARSAAAFAGGGYDVVIDGVVGPWFLPLMAGELRAARTPVDYLVLRAPLEETLRRALSRPDAEKFSARGVRQMHAAFAELGDLESHAVDTTGRTPDETLAEIERRRAAGELRLDLARLAER